MTLSDTQIANIVFNETRSLTGPNIQRARANVAHTIINAGNSQTTRPRTGPITATIPPQEASIHALCLQAVQLARQEKTRREDPTNGALNFNFRPSGSRNNFFGLPIRTQEGPLDNSYPTPGLPSSGIYANTYGR